MLVQIILRKLHLPSFVKILIFLIMKTKKETWIYALFLCVTLSIFTKSYSATETKKEAKEETKEEVQKEISDDRIIKRDLLEILILTKGTPLSP